MTETNNNALQAVYAAIDQLNRQRPADRRLPKEPQTRLIGPEGRLDSLGLVTFIVAVEEQVEDRFGKRITLTDDRVLSSENGPMRSVESLAAFIQSSVAEGSGD